MAPRVLFRLVIPSSMLRCISQCPSSGHERLPSSRFGSQQQMPVTKNRQSRCSSPNQRLVSIPYSGTHSMLPSNGSPVSLGKPPNRVAPDFSKRRVVSAVLSSSGLLSVRCFRKRECNVERRIRSSKGAISKEIRNVCSAISSWWTCSCGFWHFPAENPAGHESQRADVIRQEVALHKKAMGGGSSVCQEVLLPWTSHSSTLAIPPAPTVPTPVGK